jgi:hypothetical protein
MVGANDRSTCARCGQSVSGRRCPKELLPRARARLFGTVELGGHASTTGSTWRCVRVRPWRSSTRRPPRALKKGFLARSFRLRRGQEDQRSQAAYPGRVGLQVQRRSLDAYLVLHIAAVANTLFEIVPLGLRRGSTATRNLRRVRLDGQLTTSLGKFRADRRCIVGTHCGRRLSPQSGSHKRQRKDRSNSSDDYLHRAFVPTAHGALARLWRRP